MSITKQEIMKFKKIMYREMDEQLFDGPKLVVKRGGGHGDVLLTTPVLKALKNKWPQSHLTFITDRPNAKIVKGLPYIDQLVYLDSYFNVLGFRPQGFDYYINLIYEKMPKMHIIDAYARIADVALVDKKTEIVILQSHRDEARRFIEYYNIQDDNLLIGVHRGPTWPCRSWHQEKFRQVAEYLKTRYRAVIVEFSGHGGYGAGLGIDLTGKTSIRQTAAILEICDLLICVDSFVMHLAGAVGTPVVALFGCTDPRTRLPFNEISVGIQTEGECKNCYHMRGMKTYQACYRDRIYCMEQIGVDQVVEEIEKLLQRINKKQKIRVND